MKEVSNDLEYRFEEGWVDNRKYEMEESVDYLLFRSIANTRKRKYTDASLLK